jgi:hypothetical protein
MLKIPAEYEGDISSAKFTANSRKVSADSLLGVSAGYCQRALVDKSGMITTQKGTRNRSENGRICMGRFVRYHPVNSNY